ncbi:MAG: hypothetical protein M0Q46_02070 [Endomicrobiales bacterium]|nr:hypothetical protein [Endomicrobiales bacterium]
MNKKIIFLMFVSVFAISACAPTYPKGSVTTAVEKMLQKEEKLESKATLVGKTLYLDMQLPELSEFKTEIKQQSMKRLQAAILATMRVALSSDEKINFIVINAVVPKLNIGIKVVQMVNDIKWYIYQRISKANYEDRMIFEIAPLDKINPDIKTDLNEQEYLASMIVSQVNMMTRVNPFIGSALNNAKLRLESVKANSITLSVSDEINPEIFAFWQKAIKEKINKVLEFYDNWRPESITLYDRNGKSFEIKLDGAELKVVQKKLNT